MQRERHCADSVATLTRHHWSQLQWAQICDTADISLCHGSRLLLPLRQYHPASGMRLRPQSHLQLTARHVHYLYFGWISPCTHAHARLYTHSYTHTHTRKTNNAMREDSFAGEKGNNKHCCCCLLVLGIPATCTVYCRQASAQTILHATTLRHKLLIKLTALPDHNALTLGQPVPVLTLQCWLLAWLPPGYHSITHCDDFDPQKPGIDPCVSSASWALNTNN